MRNLIVAGKILLHHRRAAENAPMLKMLEKSGLPMMIAAVAEVVHVTLQLF
jgi:hypothetical protein